MARIPEVFERYRFEVDAELKSVVSERSSLYDMMRYHFGWMDEKGSPQPGSAGKRLRSTLCLLACQAVGGDYRQALPAAAAVEMVHNFSLVHDDIQDDERERRHRPTVWSVWGKPQAINVGTAMRLLANKALLRLDELGIPLTKRAQVQYLIDQATLRLIEGQYLDISYESRSDIEVSDYLDMIDRKTAALMACSLETGAVLGTGDDSLISGFQEIGRNLGLAFQIKDDILGIWGDLEETGKLAGNDIRRKKKSFPIVYALEATRGAHRDELLAIYQNGACGESAVATVLRILDTVEAKAGSQMMTVRYCGQAGRIISKLPLSAPAIAELEEVVSFVAGRDF